MVLFLASAALAWVYFKRFKKLQAQIAQDDIGVADRGGDGTASGVHSYEANTRRESNAARARRERREYREHRGISNLSSTPPRARKEEPKEEPTGFQGVKKEEETGPANKIRRGAMTE